MIPTIIFLFLRKYLNRRWPAFLTSFNSFKTKIGLKLIFILMISLLMSSSAKAQDHKLHYNIVRNDNVVGWIKIEKKITGDTEHIQLQSEINLKFLLNFSVQVFEEASFLKGIMISSTLHRKFNGNVKTDRKSTYTSRGYEVRENSQVQLLNISPVPINLLSLYFREPKDHLEVFSDNLGQYVKIENGGSSTYTINFPNGVVQNYYYQNGALVKVSMKDNFYTADVILVNQI